MHAIVAGWQRAFLMVMPRPYTLSMYADDGRAFECLIDSMTAVMICGVAMQNYESRGCCDTVASAAMHASDIDWSDITLHTLHCMQD